MHTTIQPAAAPADLPEQERLKIVIVGHVDHGKSTLIGRLFYDTHSLPDGKVESIRKACEAEGMEFEYAFLLDALLEEQEQNITIDTTQIQFRSDRRGYIIIDAPGHKEFLKNMITGAAHADAALLLIDANEGVQEQSKRHGYLLSLLGIKQVAVIVNKMDLVDYSPRVFERIEAEYREFLRKVHVEPLFFIPISAKLGKNIIGGCEELAWFKGRSILQALDSFQATSTDTGLPARFILQDIYRFDERRILAGRLETGAMKVGDELVFWPDRKRSRIKSFEAWGSKTPKTEALAGESVAVTLEEQIFVERGQIGSLAGQELVESREFQANLFWLNDVPLYVNQPYTLKLGTQSVEARLVKIHRVIDSSTLELAGENRDRIEKNEAAEVVIRTRKPLAFDNADRITSTGRFILLQDDRIGGGGIIHSADYIQPGATAVKSSNISWTTGEVNREIRAEHFGHRGAVIWLTGLSGSGKSTLAVAMESSLLQRGVSSFILDGDNLRHGLCSDLGFSGEDRVENIRRAGEVARLMAEAGLVVISALISPFRENRDMVRHICHNAGIPFVEVFVNAPLEVCEQRDPKDLYKKARAGEIKGFTGIDSPYEAPEKPDLTLKTDEETKEESVGKLLQLVLDASKKDGAPLGRFAPEI
ncbi:MAG: adenylyl-sulfate kinase [Methylacidiphilales bacterium]|nr:adenylyl-sulfate kinase [Candidatus Methylacidiphilales bacterium]